MEVLVIVGVPALLYFLWSKREPKSTPDVAWTPARVDATDERLPRGGARAVARVLGWTEARLFRRSAAMFQGVAFCVLILFFFYVVFRGNTRLSLWTQLVLFPIMVYPLAGMALVASHRAVLRGRRDHAEELFGATPTSAGTRTLAHCSAAWVPAVAAVLFWVAVVVASRPLTFGGIDTPLAIDGLTGVAIVLGGAGFGVLLARLVPHAVAPIVAIVAIGIVSSAIGGIGGHDWSPTRQLSTWPRYPNHDLLFTTRPVGAHLAYIVGLALCCVVLAVALHTRTPFVLAAGALAAALAIGGGVLATRPISDAHARRLASLVAQPAEHQKCKESRRVRACAFRDYVALQDEWLPAADAALEGAPPGLTRELKGERFVVSQRLQADRVDDLSSRVLDALGPPFTSRNFSWPDDGEYHAGFEGGPASVAAARIAAGLWATGSPLEARGDQRSCAIGGQARGVVALWVAYHDLPHAKAVDLVRAQPFDPEVYGDMDPAFVAGSAWPEDADVWSPVVWSPADLEAARKLLGRHHDEVRDALWAQWARFTDPKTTTDEMMAALGLDAIGPAAAAPAGTIDCA